MDSPKDPKNCMAYTFESFFRRHPEIAALALIVYRLPSTFPSNPWSQEILPNLRIVSTNLPVHSVLSLSAVGQLTHVFGTFDYDAMTHLREMKSLTQCIANVKTDLSDFFKNISPNIQKLLVESPVSHDIWALNLHFLHKHNTLTHLGRIYDISSNYRTPPPLIVEEFRQIPQLMWVAGSVDRSLLYQSGLESFFKVGITEQICKWMPIDEPKPKKSQSREYSQIMHYYGRESDRRRRGADKFLERSDKR
ncbi:hypothetical protein M422DRAFT_276672 [Sphaerobolus stellatus SS14]|uniref:Uncharacterized protein n=1 Tax=Sphaerobolus stellatus (strain SS14) TaxID=990650 RepID=A0A0C9TLX1_SPHS4|nr:hypothetical protein M422DRAFT_276672 [Sphaerobolus stellatus SS14]